MAIERNVGAVCLACPTFRKLPLREARQIRALGIPPSVLAVIDRRGRPPVGRAAFSRHGQASRRRAGVAPPAEPCRRGSRHQAAALRLQFRGPGLFSGSAASTDGSVRCQPAGAAATTSQARAVATKATAAMRRRAPSSARPRSIPVATTFCCAALAATHLPADGKLEALHRVLQACRRASAVAHATIVPATTVARELVAHARSQP